MAVNDGGVPPILAQEHYVQPSAFTSENLLREARMQKRTTGSSIPEICVLLHDEGTSYHYMAPSDYSDADAGLIAALDGAFGEFPVPVFAGATWTTDAPFRETQSAIEAMCRRNLMAVEMEAAALYAFAQVRQKPVLCFAHVTNQMGRIDGDFEKGEVDGSHDALPLSAIAGDRLRSRLLP
jgi:hypothetical protein